MAAVADCGATNGQGITKKTTYVVIGRSDSTHSANAGDLGASGKERKALDYIALGQQITVLGEREFIQLLGSAGANREVLQSVPSVSPATLSGAEQKPAAVTTVGAASVRTAPKRAAGASAEHSRQDGLDKFPEGPQWLIKLKRVLGLK